jgi:hypothetical protein
VVQYDGSSTFLLSPVKGVAINSPVDPAGFKLHKTSSKWIAEYEDSKTLSEEMLSDIQSKLLVKLEGQNWLSRRHFNI